MFRDMLTSVEVFDAELNEWTEGPTLPFYWSNGQMIVFESKIILLGGYTNDRKHLEELYELGETNFQSVIL